jgi:hypothetical protein
MAKNQLPELDELMKEGLGIAEALFLWNWLTRQDNVTVGYWRECARAKRTASSCRAKAA